MSLLKSINTEVQEGLLDGIKSVLGGKKPEAAPAPAEAEPERKANARVSGVSNREKIVTELLETSDVRYIIYTTTGVLTKNYFTKTMVSLLADDEAVLKCAKLETGDKFSLVKLPQTFQLKNMLTPISSGVDTVIILDVPKVISDKLETASTSGDPAAAKAALEALFSIKNYVASLKIKETKAIAAKIDDVGSDRAAQAAEFDPAVMRNYPNKADWDAAKSEWFDENGAGKKEKDLQNKETEGEQAERSAAADKKLQVKSSDAKIKTSVLQSLINSKHAEQALTGISTNWGSLGKEELLSQLEKIQSDLPTSKLAEVISLLKSKKS
jgi:hypothetical protein